MVPHERGDMGQVPVDGIIRRGKDRCHGTDGQDHIEEAALCVCIAVPKALAWVQSIVVDRAI